MQLVGYAGARKRSKKSEPLRMTALFGGLQCSWLDMQEHEKDLKIRASRDDGFVWGLAMQVVGYAGARKRSKKSEPLRMTALLGGLKQLVGYAGARERSKKSEPLRMTVLWEFDEKHP